jgi:hypothetical protein
MNPTDKELVRWSAERLMGYSNCSIRNEHNCNWWVKFFRNEQFPDGAYEHIISKDDWNPLSKDNGQIWDVIDMMRKKGYFINHVNGLTHHSVFFSQLSPTMGHFARAGETVRDANPCRAFLLAAWRAVERK